MPEQNIHVRFDNVQKSYDGESLVVKNLNLHIENGEFLTMLGPSGSGKTTCLMMLAGFETATHGEIFIGDEPINNIPPHKRGIGMVFQNYALFPHMTVFENLAFPLSVRHMDRSDIFTKVNRALDMVQLGEFGGRRPLQLSGGQQQRVAVARALVFEPSLVLMDEPLGALDKNLREQMQYELKHIHENLGVTVVYVTHDQSEALTMSNRIAVFNDGIIQQLASPDDLYEYPENAFVAQFIGENNRLIGKVVRDESAEGFGKGKDRDCKDPLCAVEVDGHTEVIANKIAVKAGEKTMLSLRPERVELNPQSEMTNMVSAKIEELIYLGDHIRVRLMLLGHSDFIVKVPNDAAHWRSDPSRATLKVGGDIKVGWHAEDCRALDFPAQ